jgi:hypothetical protein
MAIQELYDLDFFEWTQRNAELLSRRCFDSADIPHIAEELADMGKSDQREVLSFLTRLIMHLLKWQIQPAHRSTSRLSSIADSRVQLKRTFEQSPSLKRLAVKSVAEIYPDARRQASIETGIDRVTFPAECPYSFDQIGDDDFLPGDK